MNNPELLNISFLHCHVFFTVARYNNISKAAEELHMTQSTVTKILQRTEEVLHLKLFYRTNKGALLTEDGKFLFSQWKDVFQQFDMSLDALYQKKQGNDVKLSIALSSTLRGSSCFWPNIDIFQKRHPETILDVQGGELWDLRSKLLNGKIDILIAPEFEKEFDHSSDLNWCYVQIGKVLLFHNKNHKLKNTIPKSLYVFKDETFLMADTELIKGYENFVMSACHQAGFSPKKIIRQQNQYMIEHILRKDEAVLLGDEFFLMTDNMPDVCSTVIPNLSFGIIAIWKESNHNPAIAAFVSQFESGDPKEADN